MAKRYWQNRAILAKIEATYGVDSVPTGAANAMQMTNVTFNPSVGEEVSRELVLPYMGHQGVILVGTHATLSGDLEIAGSGTPGTPPACGPFLRSAGLKEVITAATDVQYSPISKLQESISLYFNGDGVRHVLLGARSTLTMSLTPQQIPRFSFTTTGLLGTIMDVALPAVTLTAFQKPVPVNKQNTEFELFGYAGGTEALTFDLGNQIEPTLIINDESIDHVDRQMTGNATMRADLLATINWFQKSHDHETGTLKVVHGTTAGNIVEFEAPAVQLGRVGYSETNKKMNNSLPLFLTPVAGNDEFVLTFK